MLHTIDFLDKQDVKSRRKWKYKTIVSPLMERELLHNAYYLNKNNEMQIQLSGAV